MRHAIIWTNADPIHWRIYAALGGDESIYLDFTWWRHPVETFSALLALCAGNSPVTGEFTAQRPVTRSFDVFFDLFLNKRLSKQSWGWWFEMPSHPLWRHFNDLNQCPFDRLESHIDTCILHRNICFQMHHFSAGRGINSWMYWRT